MLSTQTRLKVEFLCQRIESGQPVTLADMTWLTKWAKSNRSVHEMVQKARRRAVNGLPEAESLDGFLDDLNLGDPDPSNHLDASSSIDDLANFFKSPDWMRRD
jgi:hypothetical protein